MPLDCDRMCAHPEAKAQVSALREKWPAAHRDFVWAANVAVVGGSWGTAAGDVGGSAAGVGGVGHPDADLAAHALAVGDGHGHGIGAVSDVADLTQAGGAGTEEVDGAPCDVLGWAAGLHSQAWL